MKIQNSINNNPYKHCTQQSFEGLGFRTPSTRVRIYDGEQYVQEACQYMSNLIGQPASVITNLLKGANKNRFSFFTNMATQYKIKNHNLANGLMDDSEHIINIYKMVEKPTNAHFDIVSRTQGSFKNAEDMFRLATDDKSLDFIQTMQRNVLNGKPTSSKTIIEMLSSPNRAVYVEHPEDYASYLKLNAGNADAVSMLDKMVTKGVYKKEKYDACLAVNEMMRHKNINSLFGSYKDVLSKNYSEQGASFIKTLARNYLRKTSAEDSALKDILDMYKTFTPENYKLRMDVLNKFTMPTKVSNNITSDISELKKLYGRIDENENIRAFMDKAVRKDLHVTSPKEFNEILETVPAKMAEIFLTNLKRIVTLTKGQERKTAILNELKNPFYEPASAKSVKGGKILYGGAESDNIFSKAFRYVGNKINMYRYNRLGIEEAPLNSSVRPIKHTVKFKVKDENGVNASIALVNTPKSSREAKRLTVISDINNVIKERLHSKTFDRQQSTYADFATKMRLKLLPAIFESIKETRQADRLNGIKKSDSSNPDAVKLYKLINGKTRKLIRYMLFKRDDAGAKLYEVKDIINFVKKHNIEIEKNKKSYNLNAGDVKYYYDGLYNKMVEKHGSLTRKEYINKSN